MTTAFADTAYFLALVSPHDVAHEAEVKYARAPAPRMLTTTAVLLELGGRLSRPKDRPLFLDMVTHLRRNPAFHLVQVDDHLLDLSLQLFAEREDKDSSLTDCVSFVVMRGEGITDAATTDHHFEQAGFNVLLKV